MGHAHDVFRTIIYKNAKKYDRCTGAPLHERLF